MINLVTGATGTPHITPLNVQNLNHAIFESDNDSVVLPGFYPSSGYNISGNKLIIAKCSVMLHGRQIDITDEGIEMDFSTTTGKKRWCDIRIGMSEGSDGKESAFFRTNYGDEDTNPTEPAYYKSGNPGEATSSVRSLFHVLIANGTIESFVVSMENMDYSIRDMINNANTNIATNATTIAANKKTVLDEITGVNSNLTTRMNNLCKICTYTFADKSCAANADNVSCSATSNDIPSGYTVVAVHTVSTGVSGVAVRSFAASGSMTLINTTSSAKTAKPTMKVLCVKSNSV